MVHKSLLLTLGQSFEHITLYTYNGAAILGGGGIPIYGVLPYSIILKVCFPFLVLHSHTYLLYHALS